MSVDTHLSNEASGAEAPPILATAFRQLQMETLTLASAGVAAGGLAVLGAVPTSIDPTWGLVTGLLLCSVAFMAWMLRLGNFALAAALLVTAPLAGVIVALTWGHYQPAICLLIVPSGLAMLMFGHKTGIVVAGALSLLLGYPLPPALAIPPDWRWMAMSSIWAGLAMIWLTLRPLLTAVEWAWAHYEQAEAGLERARDTQVQLKETLADLSAANVQLTRLNQLAQGLRHASEEARRAKQEFVANVSHELRTPLNLIIGFSRMIIQNPAIYGSQLSAALLADLTVVWRNSQHLSSLIEDVLDLSQIEAGQMALTKERTDLASIIEMAITVVRPLFESKQLTLEAQIEPGMPLVYCDQTRTREVLLNLLSNAGRFTERGGVVVRAVRAGQALQVSVSDTGAGIAEGDTKRLFQPFQQLDSSLRRAHGGTGLGLALSKQFVELHGGRMWLESELGAGSTFYFTLPVDPPVSEKGTFSRWLSTDWEHRERSRPSLAPPPQIRPRFVVLDPSGALARLVTRYLDGVDIVRVTSSEAAAEELARGLGNALLVSSPASPFGRGESLIPPGIPDGTPVLICSLPSASAPAAPPVTDYLVKPVSQEALIAALEAGLAGRPSGESRSGAGQESAATVLLVDDEPDELRLFWRMLAAADGNYRVLTAGDGYEALEIIRAELPDIVVVDLLMPEMDGFELMAALQADELLRSIPLIIVSARDPHGRPIVAEAIIATRAGGLSIPQVLACVEALTTLLSPLRPSQPPASPTVLPV